jgi:hypothetical protein
MRKLEIIIFAILIIVVIVAAVTFNGKNTSNQSVSNVTLQIISTGSWNGEYAYHNGNQMINGTGDALYNLSPNPGHVTASLTNDGNGTLFVQLLQGTNVIQTQNTTVNQGTVNIDHKF